MLKYQIFHQISVNLRRMVDLHSLTIETFSPCDDARGRIERIINFHHGRGNIAISTLYVHMYVTWSRNTFWWRWQIAMDCVVRPSRFMCVLRDYSGHILVDIVVCEKQRARLCTYMYISLRRDVHACYSDTCTRGHRWHHTGGSSQWKFNWNTVLCACVFRKCTR